ncbi:MAG: enoyl-CoA hydratase/isomerase family protein [Chloroflexi bacterium]|nr:enoyl-CoA hydratase/isomerase family protein [Chloroflexota bacterium]
MSFTTVLYDKRDGVAWVTLNRPAVLNAYNLRMRDELFEVFSAVRDDAEVRALVVQGAGRAFCTGADLTEFGTAPSPTAARRIRFARDVWAALSGLDCPTVAALHGFVFGSGLEMALLCDVQVAAEGTQFGLPEVRLGMIPAAGGTQTLPRACGVGSALELLLTGRRFDAAEALRRGIVSRVVPGDRLEAETEALAGDLAALDRRAVRAIRRAVREGVDLPLEQGLRLEARLAATLRAGGEVAEGAP